MLNELPLAPGIRSLEAMSTTACADFRGIRFVEGAGHWVQQEQSEKTNELLLEFLTETAQ